MQIKKMEVQGFKSFADKTVIEFKDGVTAIVGPNGSGKSNISDSVRWVLGEQSTKNLRSSKMEDVIFSGTENRKKVGFAEVSLYIDNTDGELPVEYSEVALTRRLFRNGESSYLINGTECRLKDVQELFLDTGVGKDGYSIIGQGKIDEIISSKSEERRAIFEEASGIMKYKTRKEEALKKLDNANSNLERVNDILAEIENTLSPLEEKSIKAKKYLEIKEKLKNLDVNIFLNDVKQNAEKIAEFDSQISILNDDLKKEEQDALDMEKAKLNLKERLDDVSKKIEENQIKYYEAENEVQKSVSKKELACSNIKNSEEQINRLDEETSKDLEKIEALKEEILLKDKKKENLFKNKEKFENELLEKQAILDEKNKYLTSEEEKIEALKREIEALEEEIDNINIDSSSYEAKIEIIEKQLEGYEKGSLASEEEEKVTLEKKDVQDKINKLNENLNIVNKQKNDIDIKEKEILLKKGDISKKLDSINSEYMTKNSRLSYLKHLKEENEGFLKSVKEAINYARENNISGVYGTVADVISTDEKYEKAVEVALGGYLQNIIVDTDKEAGKLIEYLKEKNLGRATFLPLSSIKKVESVNYDKLSKHNGYIGDALDVISFDKKYKDVINLALNKCIIVDNLDNANSIYSASKDKMKIVTLQGEVIQPVGSITGGSLSQKNLGIIGRDEKIKKLAQELSVLAKNKNEYELNLKDIEEKLSETLKLKEKCNIDKEEINLKIAVMEEKLDNLIKSEEKILARKNKQIKEKESLELELSTLKDNLKQNLLKVEENNNNILSKKSIVDEYVRFNKEKQTELDILNEDITNLKISLASFDESTLSIDEMKEKLENDIKSFEEAIERKNAQKRENMLQILNLKKEIENIDTLSKDIENIKNEYISASEKLKDSKKDISEKLDVLEVKMLEGVNRNVKIKEEISKLENKKVKFDFEMDNIKNRMWDEYELTVNSSKEYAMSMPKVEDLAKAKKDAESFRKNIKELGDVDVNSIEEYNNAKGRYDFITAQKKDLDETKKKLENLISNITTLMKDQFSNNFKTINSNFKETFTKLFGGGRANLKLTDESNVLEAGIEIEVQPPGKKLQSMSLLSGGEKALTAIALLFAILKIKAPPFCILDEIEAALDDVNVSRFADYIKMYSDKTQFIVITHRKGTMEAAKTVYGVTMEEYGVSKLVSMKLK